MYSSCLYPLSLPRHLHLAFTYSPIYKKISVISIISYITNLGLFFNSIHEYLTPYGLYSAGSEANPKGRDKGRRLLKGHDMIPSLSRQACLFLWEKDTLGSKRGIIMMGFVYDEYITHYTLQGSFHGQQKSHPRVHSSFLLLLLLIPHPSPLPSPLHYPRLYLTHHLFSVYSFRIATGTRPTDGWIMDR